MLNEATGVFPQIAYRDLTPHITLEINWKLEVGVFLIAEQSYLVPKINKPLPDFKFISKKGGGVGFCTRQSNLKEKKNLLLIFINKIIPVLCSNIYWQYLPSNKNKCLPLERWLWQNWKYWLTQGIGSPTVPCVLNRSICKFW